MPTIEQLAEAARPQPVFPEGRERDGGDDWGSERQVAAQNLFFEEVEKLLPAGDFAALETFCLKADVDEMIDEALRVLARRTV